MAIVSRHPALMPPNLTQQFKKLWISRWLAENALVFLLQYIGLMFSTLTPAPVALWAASGTACAFIFLRGYSVLPGIWLGSFTAYYFAAGNPEIAFGCATLFALQAALLLFMCYRYVSPTLVFYQTGTWLKFILCSILVTALTSLALAWICYPALPNITTPPLLLWLNWWLADFNGMLVFSCALTTLDAYFPQISVLKQINRIRLGLLYGVWLVLMTAILFSQTFLSCLMLAFFTLPVIFMISRAYGWSGTACAIFLSGLLLSLGAYLEAPLFAHAYASPALLTVQILLGIEIVLGLLRAIQTTSAKLPEGLSLI